MRLLEGRVVAVTGGASGIGRAICIAAARYGASAVVVADVRNDPVEGGRPTVDEVDALGAVGMFLNTDVTNQLHLIALFEATLQLGGVDVMVCNAGIALPSDGPNMSTQDFRKITSINLDGVYFSAQGAAKQMQALGKQGSIILTSSMGGLRGSALTVVYSATKGALCMMAKGLADALGPEGIRVNTVCPGVIDTHLVQSVPAVGAIAQQFVARTPLRRMGRPSEIGDAVAWLGSDLASFVSGIDLLVDGGLSSVL
jgi:L-rhamnose 1-dehydrogenase